MSRPTLNNMLNYADEMLTLKENLANNNNNRANAENLLTKLTGTIPNWNKNKTTRLYKIVMNLANALGTNISKLKNNTNNGCRRVGALQTRGTCWLYSILNGFILSEDGVKILFARLKEIYANLKPEEKAYFNTNFNAPCPMRNLTRMNQIYFWKFLDQYLCFQSVPKPTQLRRSKSFALLRGVNLQGVKARAHSGLEGAYPQQEITQVLDHLGFKDKYYTIGSGEDKFDGRRRPQFMVVMQNTGIVKQAYMLTFPAKLMKDTKYSLMCGSLVIENKSMNNSERHRAHALAGYVCNGKGFIFDSNSTEIYRCDWWLPAEYKKVVDAEIAPRYNQFKNGKITGYLYAFAIFARKEFTNPISPSCLKRTSTGASVFVRAQINKAFNEATSYNRGMIAINALVTNGVNIKSENYVNFKKRLRAKFPGMLTQANYNKIINEARRYNNAMNVMNDLINNGAKVNAAAYANFKARLRAKFPPRKTLLNKASYNKLLNEANSYNAGMRVLNIMTGPGHNLAARPEDLENFKARLRAKFAGGAGPSRRSNNSGKNK